MTDKIRLALYRAIELARPVRLVVDDSDPILGVVQAINENPGQLPAADWPGLPIADDRRPPCAEVALSAMGGIVESVDLRRIRRIDFPKGRR